MRDLCDEDGKKERDTERNRFAFSRRRSIFLEGKLSLGRPMESK